MYVSVCHITYTVLDTAQSVSLLNEINLNYSADLKAVFFMAAHTPEWLIWLGPWHRPGGRVVVESAGQAGVGQANIRARLTRVWNDESRW